MPSSTTAPPAASGDPLAEVGEWLATVLPFFTWTQHLVVNRAVRLTAGADDATSHSSFYNPNGAEVDGKPWLFVVGGAYHDRLVRTPRAGASRTGSRRRCGGTIPCRASRRHPLRFLTTPSRSDVDRRFRPPSVRSWCGDGRAMTPRPSRRPGWRRSTRWRSRPRDPPPLRWRYGPSTIRAWSR